MTSAKCDRLRCSSEPHEFPPFGGKMAAIPCMSRRVRGRNRSANPCQLTVDLDVGVKYASWCCDELEVQRRFGSRDASNGAARRSRRGLRSVMARSHLQPDARHWAPTSESRISNRCTRNGLPDEAQFLTDSKDH